MNFAIAVLSPVGDGTRVGHIAHVAVASSSTPRIPASHMYSLRLGLGLAFALKPPIVPAGCVGFVVIDIVILCSFRRSHRLGVGVLGSALVLIRQIAHVHV